MRIVVVGLGVQGTKRKTAAGTDCIATIDPLNGAADFRDLSEVAPDSFDAALVCTPEEEKPALLHRLLSAGKHVLVEKPLFDEDESILLNLKRTARNNNVVCYTAYNHRFEPHVASVNSLLEANTLGRIYSARLFYGNGTARPVRDSLWRDQGSGVLNDLGSHLLDTILYWFGAQAEPFRMTSCRRFENRAPDHVAFRSDGDILVQLEASLLSWRNDFTADIYGKKGSAHISSLCKWGPSTLTVRHRVLPSGRPDETVETLEQPDPTWASEYTHFKSLCADPAAANFGNTDNDIWLCSTLKALGREAEAQS